MNRIIWLLCIAAALPEQALAQCPPTAGYVASTKPTLANQVLDFECTLGTNQCAAHGIVFPSSNVDLKPDLFVWLPGRDGSPNASIHLGSMVGYAGYRGIFLSWDNLTSVGEACDSGTGFIGGTCANSVCADIVRQELVTGRDDPTSDAYTPNQLDGIVHRLAMALNVEHELDMADGTQDWFWDAYCTDHPVHGTAIHWDKVVLGGHSFGGNQATYISYRQPTAGVVVMDSGYDTCEAIPPSDPYDPAPDVYDDDFSGYNLSPYADAVNWYTDQLPDESATQRVFFLHEQDIFPGVVWPTLPPSFAFLSPNAIDANSEPIGTAHYEIDLATTPWNGQPLVTTFQEPANGCGAALKAHASMASDLCMPNAVSGGDPVPVLTGDTSTLHVFDTYVDVLCSF